MNQAESVELEPQATVIRGVSTGLRLANQRLAQRLFFFFKYSRFAQRPLKQSPVERIPLIFLFG